MVVCSLLGLAAGALSQWISPAADGAGEITDLALGMGALGSFPGLAWAFLERKLEKRPGAKVSGARRRLWIFALAGLLVFGGLGALLFAGTSACFSHGLQAVGFSPPASDLPRTGALGFLYGGLLGVALGFAFVFVSCWAKR